jgi:hypothetical protein
MATNKVISAIYVSAGVDDLGNPVAKHTWDDQKYPFLVGFLVEVVGASVPTLQERMSVIANLPIVVSERVANGTDPQDTSYVVEYRISYSLDQAVFDDTVAKLKAELDVRKPLAAKRGHSLVVQEHDE